MSEWHGILSTWTKGYTLTVEEIAEELTPPSTGAKVAALFAHEQPGRSSSVVAGWLLGHGIKRHPCNIRTSVSKFVYETNPSHNSFADGYKAPTRSRKQTCSCPVREPPLRYYRIPCCLGRLGRRRHRSNVLPRLPVLRVQDGRITAARAGLGWCLEGGEALDGARAARARGGDGGLG